MKRSGRIALLVFAVLVVVAAVFHLYNPSVPADLDKFLLAEVEKMSHMESAEGTAALTNASFTQVMNKYENKWQRVEDQMRKSGASEEEVKGVLAKARTQFGDMGASNGFIYGMPVNAKRIWYRFRPVWIISFSWGIGGGNPHGIVEPPSHVRIFAIEGRKPYKKLGMQSCS